MMTKTVLTVTALALAAACGAPPKPAEPPAPAEPPTSPTATAKPEPAAAAPSSDDVKQGLAALKGGDANGAKAAFEVATQKNPKQADAWHYLGLVNERLGAAKDAEKDYRRALELDPGLEESATNLAAILVESGRNEEAIALLQRAIAKNPRNAAFQVNLGMALAAKGDAAGADKAFGEAARLDPASGITRVTWAEHLARTGRGAEASGKLKEAERLAAQDPGVLASVALAYKGLKDYRACVATLDRAIAQRDAAELRVYRGACKLGLRDLPGATAEFRDAVAKEPTSAVAHYSLGNALADGGKLEAAIAEWEATVRAAPEGPQAKAATKRIAIAKEKLKK